MLSAHELALLDSEERSSYNRLSGRDRDLYEVTLRERLKSQGFVSPSDLAGSEFKQRENSDVDKSAVAQQVKAVMSQHETSDMRDFGRILFWASLGLSLLTLIATAAAPFFFAFLIPLAGLNSVAAFMWMLGAIEMQLIKIRRALEGQRKA